MKAFDGSPLVQVGKWPLFGGLFFTAMAVLLFEIVLTRVFAVLLWYHFAYMVISLALLGFGASGSLLTWVRIGERRNQTWRLLTIFSSFFGLTILGSFFLVTSFQVDSLEIWKDPANLLGLLAYFLILAIPFLFGGLAIGAALTWNSREIGKVYCVDLAGSAIGGLSAPWLLNHFDIGAVVAFAALLAFLGAAIFSLGVSNMRWRVASGLLFSLGLILVIGFAGGGVGIPALKRHIPFAPQKVFAKYFFPDGQSERSLPSATARVDVSAPIDRALLMAADFGVGGQQRFEIRGVTQDGTAPTALYKDAGDVERFEALAHTQAATSFIAHRESGGSAPEVLVIGVGGGPDVLLALYHGASRVSAVELNPAMVRMVEEDYADYIGHLFDDPRIDLINDEGRAYLKHTDRRFDIIQLSGVDTYTALSTGAYTLSESYLYTVEAVREMYRHLKEGGLVNYSRLIITTPPRRPRESIRLANIARQALREEGVAEPWRQIAVFQGHHWASTMIRKGPFEPQQITALERFAEEEELFGFVFNPLHPEDVAHTSGGGPLYRGNAARLVPRDLGVRPDSATLALLRDALKSEVEGDVAARDIFLREATARLAASDPEQAPPEEEIHAILASATEARGAEIARHAKGRIDLQRHLDIVMKGTPEERQRFVASYPHDLRPTDDDRPFFFNYYRLSQLFEKRSASDRWYEAAPEFPVGHAVLVTSLAQILALAVLFIFLPLVPLARKGYALPRKGRFFFYFAALGASFMFLEIALMQKLILFLGHPTYSLSVVLATLLAATGLGSLASSRITEISRRTLWWLLLAVAGLTIANAFLLDPLLESLMGLGALQRIALAVVILTPTGFVLGFPFPLGIRLLERQAPVLVPWGWAINGFLSVLGSIVAIILAIAFGFTFVLGAAGVIYAVAFLTIPVAKETPPAPGPAGETRQAPALAAGLLLLLLAPSGRAAEEASGQDLESRLWAAAKAGDVAEVEEVLALGVDPDASYEFGFNALLYAAIAGHAEVVETLLEAGATVEPRDSLNHFTPLTMAALEGYCDTVENLIEHGADPDSRDLYTRRTALWFATMRGYEKCVDSMLASGRSSARTLEEALQIARRLRREEMAAKIQSALAKIDRQVAWPQFRGPGAAGVADGQNLVDHWDVETGENVVWKTPIPGLGHASPIVWGDRLFVVTAVTSGEEPQLERAPATHSVRDSKLQSWRIYALDRHQGTILWQVTALEAESMGSRHPINSYASSTPATDGRHLVAQLGDHMLFAYTVDGELLWQRDLGFINTGPIYDPQTQWGNASSPVIYEDLVIVQVDRQEDSFIAAYDIGSGEPRWKTPRPEPPSWGTPTIVGGADPELVTNGTYRIRSYDPATGEELWSLATGNSMITAATPVAGLGMVFVTNGFRPLKPTYAIRLGGRGDISLGEDETRNEQVAWSLKGGGSYYITPLLYGEHLYVLSDSGILRNYYAKTGELIYRERVSPTGASFFASPIAADDKLYLASRGGEVFILRAGLEFERLGAYSIGEEIYATPAAADGMIYLRSRRHVFALGKAPPAAAEEKEGSAP